jgi:hypothetical protein
MAAYCLFRVTAAWPGWLGEWSGSSSSGVPGVLGVIEQVPCQRLLRLNQSSA